MISLKVCRGFVNYCRINVSFLAVSWLIFSFFPTESSASESYKEGLERATRSYNNGTYTNDEYATVVLNTLILGTYPDIGSGSTVHYGIRSTGPTKEELKTMLDYFYVAAVCSGLNGKTKEIVKEEDFFNNARTLFTSLVRKVIPLNTSETQSSYQHCLVALALYTETILPWVHYKLYDKHKDLQRFALSNTQSGHWMREMADSIPALSAVSKAPVKEATAHLSGVLTTLAPTLVEGALNRYKVDRLPAPKAPVASTTSVTSSASRPSSMHSTTASSSPIPSQGYSQITGINIEAPSIDAALTRVKELITQGLKTAEIAVVLDVDGTLTTRPRPDPYQTATARQNSPAVIGALYQMGVNIVVSSAWNDFNQTQKTLNDLGLTYLLGDNTSGTDTTTIPGKSFNYIRSGYVSSVKENMRNLTYYRQKALAPLYVFPLKTLSQIKHIVFCDDSSENIRFFKDNMAQYGQSIYGPHIPPVDYIEIDDSAKAYGDHSAHMSQQATQIKGIQPIRVSVQLDTSFKLYANSLKELMVTMPDGTSRHRTLTNTGESLIRIYPDNDRYNVQFDQNDQLLGTLTVASGPFTLSVDLGQLSEKIRNTQGEALQSIVIPLKIEDGKLVAGDIQGRR